MTQQGELEMPLVSVIVLTYNQEKLIARTLDSIISQKTNFSFEIIIGEDASPDDNTRMVCEEYEEKYPHIIRLMAKAPNKGLLVNYRDCLQESRGEYIACCAGDDWWHNPDKLQMQADYLDKNKECGLVYTNYNIFSAKSNRVITNCLQRNLFEASNVAEKMLRGAFLPPLTVMFRKNLLPIDIINQFIDKKYTTEDLSSYLYMSQRCEFKCIDISTATYTHQNGSASHFRDMTKMKHFYEGVKRVKIDFLREYPDSTPVIIDEIDEMYTRMYLYYGYINDDYQLFYESYKKISHLSINDRIKYLIYKIRPLYIIIKTIKRY